MNGPVQNIAIRRVGAMGSLPALAELPRLVSTQGRTSRPWHPRRRPRRGVAIVFVLALIAITMALSYSLLRTQVTATQIQANSNQRALARQAAMTGLSAALRQIQLQAWIDDGGVSSTLSGRISADETYHVTFTTGDTSLGMSDPDYDEFPFRVTVLSTGDAVDPANTGSPATYQVKAVMRLVPRKLSSQPSSWADIQRYSLFQFKPAANAGSLECFIEMLCRIEGRVRIQGPIDLLLESPVDGSARWRLLRDLDKMRLAGLGDRRPFVDPIDLDASQSTGTTLNQLKNALSISLNETPRSITAGLTQPGEVAGYQLYPGGQTYSVPRIGRDQINIVLGPNPITNPLGMYLRAGNLNVYDNVTIRGTMILSDAKSDLNVRGRGIRFESVDLPPIEGSDVPIRLPIRLPVAILANDFDIRQNSECTVDGMMFVWGHFRFHPDNQADIDFQMQGCLLTQEFEIAVRHEWNQSDGWWGNRLSEFLDFEDALEDGSTDPRRFFPIWLEQTHGLQIAPRMTIKPGSTRVLYHWYNPGQPIYVPHPEDDGGLRWELVSWTDDPLVD